MSEQATQTAEVTASAPEIPNVGESYTGIPEAYSADPVMSEFKTFDELANKFKEYKTLADDADSKGFLIKLTDKSTPEEVSKFWGNLGRPESAAEYGFAKPEDLPEGLDYSDELQARYAEFAHKTNMPKEMAQANFAFYHEVLKEAYAAKQSQVEAQKAENLATLEKAWGGPHGSDQFNIGQANAQKAFKAVADADLAEAFKSDPLLATNPVVLQVLSRLGAKMSGDSVPSVVALDPMASFTGDSDPTKMIERFHSSGLFKEMMANPTSARGRELRNQYNDLQRKEREQAS